MWSICVLAFIILDLKVVLSRNIVQKAKALEGYMKKIATNEDEKKLAYFDKGIGNRDLRWPLGIVKYYIDHDSYDYLVVERVRLAMNSIEETSCVRFKPILEPFTDGHYLHITNPNRVRECIHETSANDTSLEIIVTIGIDCLQRRDILHLLMHALGFKDEVTHPQRDQYVRILWDNINPAYRSLFRIEHENFPSRTEYDFNSIMHFHDRAFSKNGQATIASLIPGIVIDPSRELSSLDKMKLRLMFGHECNRREVGDLLDTCKNALHIGEGKGENPEPEGDPDAKADSAGGAKDDNEEGGSAEPGDDLEEGGPAEEAGHDEQGGDEDPGGHVEEEENANEAGDVEEENHVEETEPTTRKRRRPRVNHHPNQKNLLRFTLPQPSL